MTAEFTLSACLDESAGPDDAAQGLLEQGLRHMDIRCLWGKSVLDFTDDEARAIQAACDRHGIALHCLYSDVCLSVVDTPLDDDLVRLGRLLELAQLTGATAVRIFTFTPPNHEKPANHLFAGMRRMKQVMPLIEAAGVMVLLENDVNTVGEIPSNIHSMLHAIQSPLLRLAWNPGNFVRAGVTQQVNDFWLMLGRWTGCVMLQDAALPEGRGTLPGEGDGQLRELLRALRDAGYQGMVALQPFPASSEDKSAEPERLAIVVDAARRLLAREGIRAKAG